MNQYAQILELKANTIKDTDRGYKFESLIREIQPWDSRPPIVMSPKSEQLDGVFEYKSTYFLIESKAVKKVITPGSKEWEDFELKLQRRNGSVFGIFCSLNEVSADLIRRADSLNEQRLHNIVLYGGIWKKLFDDDFDFSNLLDYMMLNAKMKFKSTVEDLTLAKKWYYNNEIIGNYFNDLCKKNSSIFVRRFIHKFHEKIYVSREIDKAIETHVRLLRPSILKTSKNDTIQQIIVLRDLSGSGKTTLSIETIRNSGYCFCFGTTANNSEIDAFLDDLLNQVRYRNNGIKEISAIDKPILLIIDSLDETTKANQPQKRREIKSLFSKINELNNLVIKDKYSRFPIVVLFTVREDYWRDWDSSFDGRDIITFKNRISMYTENEFVTALENYSNAYSYKIQNKLNEDSKNILSIPVNLEIFSEVHEYNGEITVVEVWEGKMLEEFFKKKYDNIISRNWIGHFDDRIFIEILSSIANLIVIRKNLFFTKNDFLNLLKSDFPDYLNSGKEILKLLVSELILIENNLSTDSYRFKYTRFIEYLVSLYIIEKINDGGNLSDLDKFIQVIFESQVVDIYSVLKNIKNICHVKYPELESKITDYYQKSQVYLNNFLPRLRGDIAHGKPTSKEDINQLISTTYFQDANMYWDMFFIISAKKNEQPKNTIISSFTATWSANGDSNKSKRWKLIEKLSKHNLLVEEKILKVLFTDSDAKDWEEYLGKIIELKQQEDFFELWHQIGGDSIIKKLIAKDRIEWLYVEKLLDIIVNRKKYIIGDILFETEEIDNDYITFDKKPIMIDNSLKSKIDKHINSWKLHLNNDSLHIDFLAKNDLTDKEIDYINEQFHEEVMNNDTTSFIKNLIKNVDRHYHFIYHLNHNTFLKFQIETPTEGEITILMDISESSYHEHYHLVGLLNLIFENGYIKNPVDDNYFLDSSEKKDNFYLAKAYYMVNNKLLVHNIAQIEKIIFTIESIINKKVIGYRFQKLIQVANNAIDHYPQHLNLIIKAMQIYNVYDELMSIKSFASKMENVKKVDQNHKYDDILRLIFPKLF